MSWNAPCICSLCGGTLDCFGGRSSCLAGAWNAKGGGREGDEKGPLVLVFGFALGLFDFSCTQCIFLLRAILCFLCLLLRVAALRCGRFRFFFLTCWGVIRGRFGERDRGMLPATSESVIPSMSEGRDFLSLISNYLTS